MPTTAAATKAYGLYLNGGWTKPNGAALPVLNPTTGETWATIVDATAEEVDRAVAAARTAFEGTWAQTPPATRGRLLHKLADAIEQRAQTRAETEVLDNGKWLREMLAQLKAVPSWYRYFAGIADKIHGETIPMERPSLFNYTLREPLGVIACITAWNSPLLLAAYKLAPALAAGNTGILKPSEHASISTLEFVQCFEEAGFPPGVVNVITGTGRIAGDALVRHPLVRKIAFTGSTEVGANVMRIAADDIKRVSLELGGKSANILFEDCDFDRAVASASSSALGNAGQDCCARSRVLVQQSIYDKFQKAIVTAFEKVKVGDPLKDETEMGPLITDAHRTRVMSYIESGKAEGATLASGGQAPRLSGSYLQPTVFLDAKPDMKIVREEIFGPVVAVMPFKDENEAVTMANDSKYGLSGSIWTRDISRALRVARAVQTGNLSINTGSSVHLEAPFGGVKQSGLGRELGLQVLDHYTEWKTVYIDVSA